VYNYISTQTKFYFVPWFGLMGMIVTFLFLPDTTGLDLKEAERRWQYIRAGREQDYHGVAVHPKHLSLWERMRGVGKYYNAELDYRQRIEEMHNEWEVEQERRAMEKGANGDFDDYDEDNQWSSDVNGYFSQKRGLSPGNSTAAEKQEALEISEKNGA
jgi:hypothetical protein